MHRPHPNGKLGALVIPLPLNLDPSAGQKSIVIFSHPSHELAIYGFLQRLKPTLIYLTDGGSQLRIDETLRGLEAIGITQRVHFLEHAEQSFYDAFVRADGEFFRAVTDKVRVHLDSAPVQVFCDAVEFYNPIHDISLPITCAALREFSDVPIFEVPLIHQSGQNPDTYRIQRTTTARESGQHLIRLSEKELATKRQARAEIYTLLRGQLGGALSLVPDEELRLEAVVAADLAGAREPRDCVLRYEQRAHLLQRRGQIENEILHQRNFMPILRALAQN